MRTTTLALALALVACGGKKDETGSAATGAPTGTPTGTAGGTGGGTTSPNKTAALNGVVYDCDGNGLENAQLRFCDPDVCTNQFSGADGSFDFQNELYGPNSFEVIGPQDSDLGTAFVPLMFADGETRTVDMTLCPHDPWTALTGTPTEVAHGTGLLITVANSLIEKPTPFDQDATQTTGLLVDAAHWVPTDGITGTVAAQWYLEPFNYKATAATGFDYRVDGTAVGLSAATYHVWVGSYDDFAWLDAGTISDGDADGYYTPDGDGLPLFGTVVLVEE